MILALNTLGPVINQARYVWLFRISKVSIKFKKQLLVSHYTFDANGNRSTDIDSAIKSAKYTG
jgi:hypothetical protein